MSLWMVIDLVVLFAAAWLGGQWVYRRVRRNMARRALGNRLALIYRDASWRGIATDDEP